MDKLTQAVALAERVVLLRAELSKAEGALRSLLGSNAAREAPVARRAPIAGPPVSHRVRDLLRDGKQPLSFGEIVSLVGGPGIRGAARAALKNYRARRDVRFAGGKYSWAGK
jgi:hypothetical protein